MFPILAKIGFPHSVGIYCDGRSVYVSHVMKTPALSELEQFVEPLEAGEEEVGQIARVLDRIQYRRSGLRLAFGMATDRCYFTTRPISSGAGASPKALLRESLRCNSAPVDNMAADVVRFQPDRREVASIVACKRDVVEPVGRILSGREERLVRVEPAPCALFRLALKRESKRGRAKSNVRVFLNENEALGLLTADRHPIVWRTASLAPGDEAATILSLVRALMSVTKPSGVDQQPKQVIIHGCKDLQVLVDEDWLRQQLPVPYEWREGPAFAGKEIAYGLALGGLEEKTTAFNLAKEWCRPAKLFEMLPWREAAACTAMILLMACLLSYRSIQLGGASAAAIAASRHTVAESVPTSDLEQEKKDLKARVSAVHRFVDNRVTWTAYVRELSSILPKNVYLTSIDGDATFAGPKKKGKASSKHSLVIKGAVSLPPSGLIPHELDHLLDAIREHPLITDGFPIVELADLKRYRRVADDREYAMFTVVCMPKRTRK